jgi:outer membrane protein
MAQTAPPSKVGVISMTTAIIGTKEGQKAAAELDGKFAPKEKSLKAKQEEIGAKQQELNKGATTIAEARKIQLQREIQDLTKSFNRDTEDAQAEYDQERGKIVNEIGSKMAPLLEKHAKDGGFAVILDVSSQDAPVLYVDARADLTQDIIDIYDKAFPVAAAAPPPSAAKPPAAPAAKPPAAVKPAGAR